MAARKSAEAVFASGLATSRNDVGGEAKCGIASASPFVTETRVAGRMRSTGKPGHRPLPRLTANRKSYRYAKIDAINPNGPSSERIALIPPPAGTALRQELWLA